MLEQIRSPNKKLDLFSTKFAQVQSELAVSKKVSGLLEEKVKILKRNLLQCSQYQPRLNLEINPVPLEIPDVSLEQTVCDALSLTGNITPNDVHTNH